MFRYLLLALFLFLLPFSANAQMRNPPQITILAASSISGPLTEIVRLYSKEKNVIVTASFDGTAEQASKIAQGEQADIFISAHPLWMSELKQKGLIDVYSLTNVVRNRLALVISSNSKLSSAKALDKGLAAQLNFLNKRSIMVMGDFDSSALGAYTKQTIQNLDTVGGYNLWDSLRNRIIPSVSAKNTLYLIAKGETSGIIYYSDSYNNPEVLVLNVIDESLYDPIIYQGAVVAGENMTLAREFLSFLQTEEAKKIYKKYGFILE